MSPKIKITHILTGLDLGGAERLLFDIIRLTDREVFELEVLCVVSGGYFKDEIEKLGVPVKIIGKKGKLGLKALFKIRQHLLDSKPDIVHTHLFAGDLWGRIGAIMAGVCNIVSTEHNVNISEGIIRDWFKKQTNNFAKKIIAVSLAVKNYAIKKYKTQPEKIKVIYNGIDITRFNFNQRVLSDDKIIFGTVGRLTQQKGHEFLIEAFEKVIQKNPEAELWIVGDGSLKNKLTKKIKKLNLEDKVKLLGASKNIPEILNQFDIFVMPSLWEGLGIVVLEAMASGLPVIASDVDGLKEIITDGQDGFLVEPKDAENLALKMIELSQNQELVSKFSQAGRQLVENKFDLKKIVKEYEEVYKEILN